MYVTVVLQEGFFCEETQRHTKSDAFSQTNQVQFRDRTVIFSSFAGWPQRDLGCES